MSVSIEYADWWEAFYKNGTTYQVYGRTSISIPSWDNVEATWEDYFDCSWFSSNTYVLCLVMQVENTGSSSSSTSIRADIRVGSTTIATVMNTTSTISAWATKAFKTAVRLSQLTGYEDFTVRFIAWDLDWTDMSYYTFSIYEPPGWIDCYYGVWEGLNYGWSLLATFYQKDIDQDISSVSALNTFTPYNSTSSFDLSYCGVWDWVGCFAVYWENLYTTSKTLSSITLKLQAYKNWWVDRKTKTLSWSISAWGYRWWYFDFSIIPWEIWTDATTYRVTWSRTVWDDSWSITQQFTITNLDIDDVQHEPWYLWVEWYRICYTDWYGYKHSLSIDNVSSYVWTDKAWYIRIDEDRPLWLTYIWANWYKYYTETFRTWYWWNVNVWSSNAGYIWVSSWTSASNARYCLCMVAPNWNKMRIINHWNS